MGGMLPMKSLAFDFKIWSLAHQGVISTRILVFSITSQTCLLYMMASIAGGYTFLELTKSAMANDFWWAGFDASTQASLGNCSNQALQLSSASAAFDLTNISYGGLLTASNSTLSTIQVAPLYSISIQDEVNSLPNVIQGLRQMDGCQVPWIMTAYCYADFERRWEMANTQKKQQRCVEESNNAAVYLESILRNADQTSLTSCWGKALEIGVYLHLKSTAQAAQWIVTTQERKTTVPEEAQVWLNAGMTKFATQWQITSGWESSNQYL
ncbi:hypothetical protein AC1031_010981 [Aphanomyces cochlioides]|nr:hypothetical protein AC1031_010981 [Aphanomyces cochlioides]